MTWKKYIAKYRIYAQPVPLKLLSQYWKSFVQQFHKSTDRVMLQCFTTRFIPVPFLFSPFATCVKYLQREVNIETHVIIIFQFIFKLRIFQDAELSTESVAQPSMYSNYESSIRFQKKIHVFSVWIPSVLQFPPFRVFFFFFFFFFPLSMRNPGSLDLTETCIYSLDSEWPRLSILATVTDLKYTGSIQNNLTNFNKLKKKVNHRLRVQELF